MDLSIPNQNIQYKVGATNMQLQRAIEAAVPSAVKQMKGMASRFQGVSEIDTCRKIFDYLKNNIHYKVDGDNQKIKLPSALIREGEGDCKSYALFTAAVLSNLKIPYKFVYASYNPNDRTPEHIYVCTNSGTIIDAVWGKFNSEKKPCFKYYKPMNISYISGIKEHKKSPKHYYKKRIGNTCSPAMGAIGSVGSVGSMGIGRTWADWARVVGVYNSFSSGMVAEIWTKNAALGPAREIVEMMISKNAGGLANFLYNLSPMNEGQINSTNLELLKSNRDLLIKKLNEKYPLANQAQSSIQTAKYQTITDPKTGKTYQVLLSQDTNVAAKQAQLTAWTKEFNAGVVELYKKYPFIVKGASTPAAQAKYREIELAWVKSFGGNPDDLNNAVKEGNSKTPVGKTFNYLLAKLYNGQNPGVGLTIRGLIDALFTGNKFQLGDKDAFNITFYGVQQGANVSDTAMSQYLNSIGIKGMDGKIGLTTTTVLAYSAVVYEITKQAIDLYSKAKIAGIFKDPSGTLNDQQQADIQNQNAANAQTGVFSGNTGTYLIIGGGALAAYFLMKK